ncbi:MAG: ABC transporter permease [Ramlibacter sp.]|nr:ABC transporter permease [Ramlibacter sp.]
MKSFVSAYVRHKAGVAGLIVLLVACAVALAAPLLYPGNPWDMVNGPFLPPGTDGALLGTDTLGRDIAAGLVHGARVSLLLGVVSTAVAVVIGVALGAVAGYCGGKVDQIVMAVTEIFQTIPTFLLAVVLVAVLTPSIRTIVLAVAIVSWPALARLVRAEFMALRSREFVQAARLAGQSNTRIVFSQILPNSLSPVIVMGSMMVASAILLESGLSFMGLGDPNLMSWGYIIGASRSVIREAWWMSVFPGIAIALTVLALSLIGEALNDALNPKLQAKAG